MGRVHTQAYLRLPHHFPQLSIRPELVAVADDVPGRAADAAARYGFAAAASDWRQIAADQRVQAVSITAPNFLHREIGVAMAAGRQAPLDREAGRAVRRRHPGHGRGGAQGGVQVRRRLQLPQRARRRGGPRADLVGRDRRRHPRPDPHAQRLRRPPRRRSHLALRAGPGRHRRARRPGLARRRPGPLTCSARSPRSSPTPPSSSPRAPARPGPPPGTRGPRAASRARSRTRTSSRACCASPPAPAACSRRCRVSVGEQNNYGFEVHGTQGAVMWDFRRMGELTRQHRVRLPGPAAAHRVRRPAATASTARSSRARRTP